MTKIVDLNTHRASLPMKPGDLRDDDTTTPPRLILQIDEDCRLAIEEPSPGKPGQIWLKTPLGAFRVGHCDDEDAMQDMMRALSNAIKGGG